MCIASGMGVSYGEGDEGERWRKEDLRERIGCSLVVGVLDCWGSCARSVSRVFLRRECGGRGGPLLGVLVRHFVGSFGK